MWAIFLISAMGFAIAAMVLVWIGNKIINSMIKENRKLEKEEEKKDNE